MLAIGIDYLQGTHSFNSFQEFIEFLDNICLLINDSIAYYNRPFFCGLRYDRSFYSQNGINGGYSLVDCTVRALFKISGKFLSRLNLEQQFNLLDTLINTYKIKLTRIDIAVDDYSRRVGFSEVIEAVEAGQFGGARSYRYYKDNENPTIYLGSEHSDKTLRFYNAESQHGIKADRWELQLRNVKAIEAARVILSHGFKAAGMLITGGFTFGVAPDKIGDAPNLFSWWQSLRDEIGGAIHISVPTPDRDIDKSIKWLERQAAVILATLYYGLGSDGFDDLIKRLVKNGSTRLTPSKVAAINDLKKVR